MIPWGKDIPVVIIELNTSPGSAINTGSSLGGSLAITVNCWPVDSLFLLHHTHASGNRISFSACAFERTSKPNACATASEDWRTGNRSERATSQHSHKRPRRGEISSSSTLTDVQIVSDVAEREFVLIKLRDIKRKFSGSLLPVSGAYVKQTGELQFTHPKQNKGSGPGKGVSRKGVQQRRMNLSEEVLRYRSFR